MKLVEKRPWATTAIFSLILIVTAVALEFGFASVDPWRLPSSSKAHLNFAVNSFPSLIGVSLSCAESQPLTRVDVAAKQATCTAFLSDEMTRCSDSAPLRGFADKIRCAKMEKASCGDSGLQSMGLFKGDSACAHSTSETDLGPPAQRANRPDDI